MDEFSERDREIICRTVRAVAARIEQDVLAMELSPRPKSAEFSLAAWGRVAEAVRDWESDILYDMTGYDDGR